MAAYRGYPVPEKEKEGLVGAFLVKMLSRYRNTQRSGRRKGRRGGKENV